METGNRSHVFMVEASASDGEEVVGFTLVKGASGQEFCSMYIVVGAGWTKRSVSQRLASCVWSRQETTKEGKPIQSLSAAPQAAGRAVTLRSSARLLVLVEYISTRYTRTNILIPYCTSHYRAIPFIS